MSDMLPKKVYRVWILQDLVSDLPDQYEEELELREAWELDNGPYSPPSQRHVYITREGAEKRAALIRSYGYAVEVVESAVGWTNVHEADRQRAELEQSMVYGALETAMG